ncbi:MAG: hypothetical protein HUJ27_09615 [Rhodobacteraceae bacterium]|nr:hypothetical protein [Paracoccaceae bacterium]
MSGPTLKPSPAELHARVLRMVQDASFLERVGSALLPAARDHEAIQRVRALSSSSPKLRIVRDND